MLAVQIGFLAHELLAGVTSLISRRFVDLLQQGHDDNEYFSPLACGSH
jgi:hypothetical protein